MAKNDASSKVYGEVRGNYTQKTIRERIEALFLNNLGKIIRRDQILQVAKDPKTGKVPENWHQRLSELRTDSGYTILTKRDLNYLTVSEYLMLDDKKRVIAGKRIKPTKMTWGKILKRAKNSCEWNEGGEKCGIKDGEIDPVGGGKVKLTPDHKSPHSLNPDSDPNDPEQWQALCGRHQVVKKNFWDNTTGKLNTYAIVQAATHKEKLEVFKFLLDYFGVKIKKKKDE